MKTVLLHEEKCEMHLNRQQVFVSMVLLLIYCAISPLARHIKSRFTERGLYKLHRWLQKFPSCSKQFGLKGKIILSQQAFVTSVNYHATD